MDLDFTLPFHSFHAGTLVVAIAFLTVSSASQGGEERVKCSQGAMLEGQMGVLNLGKHRAGEKMALLTEPREEIAAQFLSTELWGDRQLPPKK